MGLQNFVDKVGPVVSAVWLNTVDTLKYTIFGDATTKAQARTNLTSDAPLEVNNGGTGVRTGIYPQTTYEIAAGVTPTNLIYRTEPYDVRRYGAVMDGTTDDSAAFAKLALVMGQGGSGFLPPLPMMLKSQVSITAPNYKKIELWGYGSTILTTGAIDGLQVKGGFMGGLTTYGVTIDNSTDSLSTAGFRGVGCSHCDWVDCSVKLSNVIGAATGYAGIRLDQSTADDQNTGAFWNTITRFQTRQPSGNPTFYASYGVLLTGSANATTIQGCSFSSVNVGVGINAVLEAGNVGYIANGVLIQGNAFEGPPNAIYVNSNGVAGGSNLSGLRIVGNRAESISGYFLYLYQIAVDSPVPTWLSGNYFVSSVLGYVGQSGPVPITVNSWEPSITPHYGTPITATGALGGGAVNATLTAVWLKPTSEYSISFSNGDVRVGTLTYNSNALTWPTGLSGSATTAIYVNDGDMTRVEGTGSFNFKSNYGDPGVFEGRSGWGISLTSPDTNTRNWAARNRAGGGATIDAPNGQDLQNVNAISGTSTQAKNLRGTATFAASATKTVTFTTEPDANFYIALSGNPAGYCWVTSKSTAGFIINCSAVNSNSVDWIMIR